MSRRNRRLLRYGLPVAGLALALLGAAVAGMVAHASTRATRVTVTEKEYKLSLSSKSFKPGSYTFVALDKGKLSHSLEISGPGVTNKRIPGTIKPGASRSLTVTLRTGTYAIWCPVDGHAGLGMKARITVGAGGAAGSSSSGGTTTKKTGWG